MDGRAMVLILRRDVLDGGAYQIAGKVTEFLVPGRYRVRLHDQKTGRLVQQVWSDSSGNYTFDLISSDSKYVIAFDHTSPVQNAAIQDNVVPS